MTEDTKENIIPLQLFMDDELGWAYCCSNCHRVLMGYAKVMRCKCGKLVSNNRKGIDEWTGRVKWK